ncbi:MAG: radical SAM protein [Planctomycetota bacterium]
MSSEGWILPRSSHLFLEEGGALVLLDAQGQRAARFEGEVAALLRIHLGGDLGGPPAPASPLLATLRRLVPGLEALLAEEALPATPAHALRRGGWGQLFVELTARCNERCLHCYVGAGPERSEALPRATLSAVLVEAAALGFRVVQLTGGEALLSPHVADGAHEARALGVPEVEVYTNGVLLDERRYAALRAAECSFAFSLYARDPARHDEITRLPGSHARTVAAIRRALAGGSRVRAGVIAVTPADEPHALAAADLARELGVERVGIDVARGVGRGRYAGRPVPMAPSPAAAAAAAIEAWSPGHAAVRGGKAAVLADGWVTPCIFSRDLRLGRVGPEGGLRAALERPAARVTGRCDQVAASLSALEAGLACAECRLGRALLEPCHPAAAGAVA